MCLEPKFYSADETHVLGRVVVCQKCWQCKDRSVSDWVGRCIAEGRTAQASHFVTCTYGRDEHDNPDHIRASVLTYSDFQKWLKRLRKAGHPVRYLVTGEYGSLYGRTHWHALLFWQKRPPVIQMRKDMVVQAHWHDGFSYWDEIGHHTARYACKYILKDEADELKQSMLRQSKRPPLGAEYFSGLALKYVKAGLSPRDKVYKFREVLGAEGNPKKFYLGGRSWELFVEAYLFWWELLRPGQHWPDSQVVWDHLDSLVGDWRDVVAGHRPIYCEGRTADGEFLSDLAEEEDNRRWEREFRESDPALTGWMTDHRVAWSDRFFCPVYQPDGRFMPPLYWHAERGSYRWQSVAPSEAYIRAQRFERHRVAAGRPLRGTRMDWPRPRPTSS